MEVTKLVDVGGRVQLGTESEGVPNVVCACSTAPREIFGKSFCLLVVLLVSELDHDSVIDTHRSLPPLSLTL
jgi:hypothetical protein